MEAHNGARRNISEIIQELEILKSKISELPKKYPTGTFTFGAGAGRAQEQIPLICRNIDEAIRALTTGLDPYNRPITKSQVADGLNRLVNSTKNPAFVGLMSGILDSQGIRTLENCMSELEQIASVMPQAVTERHAPIKKKEKVNHCPKCEAPIKEGSSFCENCGANLQKIEKNDSFKKAPLILSVAAIIAVILIGYYGFSSVWNSAPAEIPSQTPQESVVQTTTPPPTISPTTAAAPEHDDEAYLRWTTETLDALTQIGKSIQELSTEESSEEGMEEAAILYKDLSDLAKEALDEEKGFKVSPELEPAEREFVKILNAVRWAGYYGERGIRNQDADDLSKKGEYLDTAEAAMERFNELVESFESEETSTQTTGTTAPTTGSTERMTAREAYSIAEDLAKSEYGDLYLKSARAGGTFFFTDMRSLPVEGKSFIWNFEFSSPGAQKKIHIDVENGTATVDRIADWSDYDKEYWEDSVIDPAAWKIDSPEAEQLADNRGGEEFKSMDPNNCLRSMVLSAYKDSLSWRVDYGPLRSKNGELPGVRITIDATTGDFKRKEETKYT